MNRNIEQGSQMSDTKIYLLTCVLLIISGIAIGGLLNGGLNAFDLVHKATSILASIATILGIIIAVKGLFAWKQQFSYQKIDQNLESLEDMIHDIVSIYVDIWFAEVEYILELNYLEQNDGLSLKEKNEALRVRLSASKKLAPLLVAYEKQFARLKHYAQISSSDPISIKFIQAEHRVIFERIKEDGKKGFPFEGGHFKYVYEDLAYLAADIEKKMYANISEIRKAYIPAKF
jgi:hypothetical protein